MKKIKNGKLIEGDREKYLVLRICIDESVSDYMVFNCHFFETSSYFKPIAQANFSVYDFDLPKKLKGISNIKIHGQAGGLSLDSEIKKEVYARKVEFSGSDATLREIESVIPLMRRIEKELDRQSEVFGQPKNFSDYIGRIAEIIGVKYFYFDFSKNDQLCELSSMKYTVEGRLKAFFERLEERKQVCC